MLKSITECFKIAKDIIVLPLSNFIPLTPDEFKPENNLNFSTGKRKHFHLMKKAKYHHL